jgi:hypothetical protein
MLSRQKLLTQHAASNVQYLESSVNSTDKNKKKRNAVMEFSATTGNFHRQHLKLRS